MQPSDLGNFLKYSPWIAIAVAALIASTTPKLKRWQQFLLTWLGMVVLFFVVKSAGYNGDLAMPPVVGISTMLGTTIVGFLLFLGLNWLYRRSQGGSGASRKL